jgi:hypothetical protein
MNTARVELPVWDCTVAVIDNRLCAGRSAADEDEEDVELIAVDFLCPEFLGDASRALDVAFTCDEFDIVTCGCEPSDERTIRVTRTP